MFAALIELGVSPVVGWIWDLVTLVSVLAMGWAAFGTRIHSAIGAMWEPPSWVWWWLWRKNEK